MGPYLNMSVLHGLAMPSARILVALSSVQAKMSCKTHRVHDRPLAFKPSDRLGAIPNGWRMLGVHHDLNERRTAG